MLGASAVLLSGCKGGNDKGGNTPADDPDKSLWKSTAVIPSAVDVYAGKNFGKLVQSDVFEIDAQNRVISFSREDVVRGKTLMDLKYSYSGKTTATISGTFVGVGNKNITASCDEDDTSVSYKGDWAASPVNLVTTYEDGVVKSTVFDDSSEDASHFSNSSKYTETYTVNKDGDITKVVIGTKNTGTAKATNPTGFQSSSEVEFTYTYSEYEDLNNFNAYLMPCSFPVWYAKGLPGCKHLISGMTSKCGNVSHRASFKVEYEIDEDGTIISAIRTDYTDDKAILVRKYMLFY